MNAQSNIQRFNALAAYEAEREVNRRLFDLLGKVLFVAEGLADKAARRGDDVSHANLLFSNARKERLL